MDRKEGRKILGVITARGGSKGLPRKNVLELNGKPLIAWTIDSAKRSKYLDKVVVSTEDKEIARISRKFNAEVIDRPKELATDAATSIDVIKHAISFLDKSEKYKPEIVVILQPTSPLRDESEIDAAIKKLIETGADSVISVSEYETSPFLAYTLDSAGRMDLLIKSGYNSSRRQDIPKAYKPNGAVYALRTDTLMKENRIVGNDTRALIMPKDRSVDIDDATDYKLAELLLMKRKKK
jgi:CMP-N,N'-diacetyllegionaminic acid synthase